ncbi:MAG: DNA polymerase III subunit gamma/tau [Proteobacteria bacterium]|nr:DNA polymerase III subunit gamma/tau [Pseudomonadota bacterium]
MSYQVLARKYRPQKFSEVVGQDHITTTLKNALAQGRIHHAYLFTGVRGVGKTTVARLFAKALNCESAREFEPCGECGPCREITDGRSLDVQEIDGASNNGVDEVREIRERVKYVPSSCRYKIYIIDEVHMLSTAAFNALLKTLEEPPPHVVFMFATTESHRLPATILSRCQRHDFRRIPAPLISSALSRIASQESVSIEDDALRLIAREATGSLRDAQSLFDQAIAYSGRQISYESMKGMLGFLDRALLFGTVEAVLARDPARALAALDEIFSTGADLARFAGDVLEVLRHLLVLAECKGERVSLDLTSEESDILLKLANGADATLLHQMFSTWYGIAEQLSHSPFPKMLLEVGLMRMCRIGPAQPIAEVVARLDALLDEGAGAAPAPAPAPSAPAPEPRREMAAAEAEYDAEAAPSDLAFEPVDMEVERRWQEFMRWLVTEKPQAAAIVQQGSLESLSADCAKIRFDNPHFADMLAEEERKTSVEGLMAAFFKRPMRIAISSEAATKDAAKRHDKAGDKSALVKEALSDDIVRQAADILGAKLHDVKTNFR